MERAGPAQEMGATVNQWENWVMRALREQPMTTGEIFAYIQARVSFRFGRPRECRSAIEATCERLRGGGSLERHQIGGNGIRRWVRAVEVRAA
jgi:hypothetical protein